MEELIISGASPVLVPREDPAGKIIFAVVVLLFGLACFVALMVFIAAVLRGPTARTKLAIRDMPLYAFVAGVVGYGLFGAASAWLYSRAYIERLLETEFIPGMVAAASCVAVVPLLASLIGAAGLFGCVGDRLALMRGREMTGLQRSAMGTLVSVLAAWFPIVGWFVITPAMLALSAGAFLLGQLRPAIPGEGG